MRRSGTRGRALPWLQQQLQQRRWLIRWHGVLLGVSVTPCLSASPRRTRNTNSHREIGPKWHDAAFKVNIFKPDLFIYSPHLASCVHPWTKRAVITDVRAARENEQWVWQMRVWRVSSSAESLVAAAFSINPKCLKRQCLTGDQKLTMVTGQWAEAAKQRWRSLVKSASTSTLDCWVEAFSPSLIEVCQCLPISKRKMAFISRCQFIDCKMFQVLIVLVALISMWYVCFCVCSSAISFEAQMFKPSI